MTGVCGADKKTQEAVLQFKGGPSRAVRLVSTLLICKS